MKKREVRSNFFSCFSCLTIKLSNFTFEILLIAVRHFFSAHFSCRGKFLNRLSTNFLMKNIQLIRMNIRSITTTMLHKKILTKIFHSNLFRLPVPLREYKILSKPPLLQDYLLQQSPRTCREIFVRMNSIEKKILRALLSVMVKLLMRILRNRSRREK